MSRNSIFTNQELYRGDYLLSNNEGYKAVFQDDGNFVVYGWKPIWASNSCNSGGKRLVVQSDGNLVIYTENNSAVWSTGTFSGKDNFCCLRLLNNGTLVLLKNEKSVWSSA